MTGRHRKRRGPAGNCARPAPVLFNRRQLLAAGPVLALTGGTAVPNDSPDWTTNIARPQTSYPGSPFAYTAAGLNFNIGLTPDVYTVGLAFNDNSSLTSLDVVGNVSQTTYLSLRPLLATPGPVQWIPVMSVVDTSINVDIVASAAGSVYVVLMGESAGVIAYPANGVMDVQIVAEPFAVTFDQVQATSNLWLHPRSILGLDTGNLAASGSLTLIPGVAGQRIYLHSMLAYPLDGGTFLNVFDGTGSGTRVDTFVGQVAGTPTNAYVPGYPPHPYLGVPLTTGNACTVMNSGSGTHRWIGNVIYSQG